MAVQCIPGKLTMSNDSDDVDIEAFSNTHENLDDVERDARDSEAADAKVQECIQTGGSIHIWSTYKIRSVNLPSPSQGLFLWSRFAGPPTFQPRLDP